MYETRLVLPLQRGYADTVVAVTANRRRVLFRAVLKEVDRFEIPDGLKSRPRGIRGTALLVAPYLSRELSERCLGLRQPFIDTAGNAYLEGPGLFVYVTGQPRPAEVLRQRFRALNAAGLQIVFALLCNPALLHTNYREIASRAGVSLGAVGPVLKDLEARGYLGRRRAQTPARLVDTTRLLKEWVSHYPITLRPKLNPRRFEADLDRLLKIKAGQTQALWGGEVAADRLTGYLRPAEYTLYARAPITRLAAAGRLRAAAKGPVEVLDRFWNFEADPAHRDLVPAILIYADLLASHDARNLETAQAIYEQHIAPRLRTPEQTA